MIDHVRLDRLHIPLVSPYRLSTVTVNVFDVILVRVETDDGRNGVGEVTTLEGYSAETGDVAWSNLTSVCRTVLGLPLDVARDRVQAELTDYPFSASGFVTAVETAGEVDIEPTTAPIVGILSADDPPDERHTDLQDQINAGFETIKIKIGFEPIADAEAVLKIIETAPNSISFRVDANQGYSLPEAMTFIDRAPIDRLNYLEQPLPVNNLSEHATLRMYSDLDILLDEEVETTADVTRIEQARAADGVKFKLMKCGGIQRSIAAIEKALERGFTVSFGNGVQSDVGCIHEALVWRTTDLSTAGEFNGWRKQSKNILAGEGLSLADGELCWHGESMSLDEATLDRYRIDGCEFDRTG